MKRPPQIHQRMQALPGLPCIPMRPGTVLYDGRGVTNFMQCHTNADVSARLLEETIESGANPAINASISSPRAVCCTNSVPPTRYRIRHRGLDSPQVDSRCLALLASFQIELDPLTLAQVPDAGSFHGGNVNEDILRAIVWLNKAEPFGGVEPFH